MNLPPSRLLLLAGLLALPLVSSLAADISDTASRTTQPDKFLSAPGLIKGGIFMQGSKKRFEGANELNLESYQTRLEVAPAELSLDRIRDPEPNDQITLKFTLKNESDKGSTLYFPTAQRCEAVIRDSEGKVIYTGRRITSSLKTPATATSMRVSTSTTNSPFPIKHSEEKSPLANPPLRRVW